MAANDPGLAPMAAPALDPAKGMVALDKDEETRDGMLIQEEMPIAPDQFDAKYETSRWEIWAYYSYYIGNNGMYYDGDIIPPRSVSTRGRTVVCANKCHSPCRPDTLQLCSNSGAELTLSASSNHRRP